MSDIMIEAKDLTKRYGEFTALDKASFNVRRGEVLGFLGPNGAGKTTAMKILTCFIAPSEGSAKVNGCDVFDDPMGARSALGYLPEANPLYTEMLVVEYLRWAGDMRGLPADRLRSRLKTVVEQTALGDVLGKEIRALSKGYRQRVGLAQALLHEPPILILDEPMSGLDPNQTIEIRDLIKEIGRERTVVFSTHNLAEVAVTCNRVLIVSGGKIVADAKPNELRGHGGKPSYHVALAEGNGNGKNAAEALKAVSEVFDVKTVAGAPNGEQHFEVIAKGTDDLRPKLANAIQDKGLTLLELFRKRVDLESVFRDLTAGKGGKAGAKARAKRAKEEALERKSQEQDAVEPAACEGHDPEDENKGDAADDDAASSATGTEGK